MTITIIPAAGDSLRFKNLGYSTPKPSIVVANNPIIYWSLLGSKKSIKSDKTVIVAKNLDVEIISKSIFLSNKKLNLKNLKIVAINESTSGPAETVAQCLINLGPELDRTSPIYCLDSDMFLLFDNKKVFWDLEKECYIVAGESNHPEHCYLDTNKNKVISISEKKKISNLAIVGCYIFKSADTYLNLYEKAKQNLKKDKEFYISDVVKESVVRNTCGHILADTYLSLGTPAEVGISEPYLKNLFNSDCF